MADENEARQTVAEKLEELRREALSDVDVAERRYNESNEATKAYRLELRAAVKVAVDAGCSLEDVAQAAAIATGTVRSWIAEPKAGEVEGQESIEDDGTPDESGMEDDEADTPAPKAKHAREAVTPGVQGAPNVLGT